MPRPGSPAHCTVVGQPLTQRSARHSLSPAWARATDRQTASPRLPPPRRPRPRPSPACPIPGLPPPPPRPPYPGPAAEATLRERTRREGPGVTSAAVLPARPLRAPTATAALRPLKADAPPVGEGSRRPAAQPGQAVGRAPARGRGRRRRRVLRAAPPPPPAPARGAAVLGSAPEPGVSAAPAGLPQRLPRVLGGPRAASRRAIGAPAGRPRPMRPCRPNRLVPSRATL